MLYYYYYYYFNVCVLLLLLAVVVIVFLLLWHRFATTSAEANSGWPNAQALPECEGRVGRLSRCRWWNATPLFAGSVWV